MNVQQYTFCDVFLISILNNGSKYVKLVMNHTTTSFAESKGLASACIRDQIRTWNILKPQYWRQVRKPLLHHSSICTVFGASWVQQFSTLCVKRYGVIHRTWKGGQVVFKIVFNTFQCQNPA